MTTQWTITKDHMADADEPEGTDCNAKGVIGPDTATLTHDQIRKHPKRMAFQIFDDDGERYYDGFVVPGEDDYDEDYGRALRDFGAPNAGATLIKVKIDGKWEGYD